MNPKSLVLASLVFFHKGDYVPAYEFNHYPCSIDSIYIAGLDANNVYLSDGYSYYYEDEQLFTVYPGNTSFKIYNKDDDQYLDTIYLRWNTTECDKEDIEIAKEITQVIGPDEITIEKGSDIKEVINQFKIINEGKDHTNTISITEIEPNIEGKYQAIIEGENEIKKEIIINVIEPKEEEKNESSKHYPVLFVCILGVIAICVKYYRS